MLEIPCTLKVENIRFSDLKVVTFDCSLISEDGTILENDIHLHYTNHDVTFLQWVSDAVKSYFGADLTKALTEKEED